MEGWVKLHRSLLDWEWWDDFNVTRLWIYILLRANHEENNWRGITIPPGTFITSYEKMSDGTRLTVGEIRTALKKLKNSKNVTIKTTNKYQAITVVKWALYQSDEEKVTSNHADKLQTINKPLATNKNDKNDKNIYTYSCYSAYMRVISPTPSQIAVDTIHSYIADGVDEDCITAIIEYCDNEGRRSWNYLETVLRNSFKQGIRTRDDFYRAQQEFKAAKESKRAALPQKPKNKFINHRQRDIDYNELAQKALKERLGQPKSGDCGNESEEIKARLFAKINGGEQCG